MAYQFTDSFDHYNTAFLTGGNLYEYVTGSPVISSAYSRFPAIAGFPNQGVYLPAGNGLIRKNLKSNQATLIAFMTYGGALPSSGFCSILNFYDLGTLQLYLAVNSAGGLQFVRGTGGVLVASANRLLSTTSLPSHGIEVQVTFSNGSGSVECWLDGALVISLTGGLNTIVSANAYANQVGIGYVEGSGAAIYCDYFRVWDSTGSYQNAPVGFDCRKLTKLPAGAGYYTQWTANGATYDWQCVDDASPDGDATYVSSNGNNYDSYAMGTSGLAGLPSQVVVKSYARKDDSATRALEIGVRSGTSNGLGTAFTLGSTYQWVDSCISVDPATGSPPTAAAADAYQFLKYESA